ncbi:ABC transporter ATP-binding protein [Boudabousia tangfeifanii]|uniref:ABC transporter ATP-binding protein n=1 Tax=Boudabousia tangfeifanii TaxID=1912795 RepID=UPI0014781654|nr:ABC transporter ATP-binding protein [Boudabousia tangfeifanii]
MSENSKLGLRGLRDLLVTAWRLSPITFFLSLIELVTTVMMGLSALFISWFLQALGSGDTSRMVVAGVFLTLSVGLPSVTMVAGVNARVLLMRKISLEMSGRVLTLFDRVPTLRIFHDEKAQTQVKELADQSSVMGMAFNSLMNALQGLLRPISILASALLIDWRLLFVVFASLSFLWLGKLAPKWSEQAEDASAPFSRRLTHLQSVVGRSSAGGELRQHGKTLAMANLVGRTGFAWQHPHYVAEAKENGVYALISAFYLLVSGVVLFLLAQDVSAGKTSAAILGGAIAAVISIREAFGALTWSITSLFQVLRTCGRYEWLQRFVAEESAAHSGRERLDGVVEAGDRVGFDLELRDLSFTYPGASEPALSGLNVTLPAGKVVALVGENGCGKTTLANLLSGMFDPTGGQILVGGTPLPEVDLAWWRSRLSAAFQDHVNFELNLGQVVALGAAFDQGGSSSACEASPGDGDATVDAGSAILSTDLDPKAALQVGDLGVDESVILTALSRAGADSLVGSLPQGLDTPLGKSSGGEDLSGGQWQRLAIARALARKNPALLILDEPTSAMDAMAEAEIFENYIAATRQLRELGASCLLITHRFSTVSAADLIVVLKQGRVVEVGSHQELLARHGHYAELYQLQAGQYQ